MTHPVKILLPLVTRNARISAAEMEAVRLVLKLAAARGHAKPILCSCNE